MRQLSLCENAGRRETGARLRPVSLPRRLFQSAENGSRLPLLQCPREVSRASRSNLCCGGSLVPRVTVSVRTWSALRSREPPT